MTLSKAQVRALLALDTEGSYGLFRDRAPQFSLNYYGEHHRPGNIIIDARTARVLIVRGLAEVRHGRLFVTEKGQQEQRNLRSAR